MNVKCAFLNGELAEEVLCTTVPDFGFLNLVDFVYLLFKALNRLE